MPVDKSKLKWEINFSIFLLFRILDMGEVEEEIDDLENMKNKHKKLLNSGGIKKKNHFKVNNIP